MQIIQLFSILILASIFPLGSAWGQIATAKGIATVNMKRSKPSTDEIAQAKREAVAKAFERYLAELPRAKQRLVRTCGRDRLMAGLDNFILSDVVLSESPNKADKTLQVVSKVEINVNEVEFELEDCTNTGPLNTQFNSQIAMVIVARKQGSVTYFGPETSSEVSTGGAGSALHTVAKTGEESENITRDSIATKTEEAELQTTSSDQKTTINTSAEATQKADYVVWDIASSRVTEQQISSVLTDIGLRIVPTEFLEGLDLAAIRKDFGDQDELEPQTSRRMAQTLASLGLQYVLVGTLDIDMPGIDPISGNIRTSVIVTADVLNIQNAFVPERLMTMEPNQSIGLGPTEQIATTNAIQIAAEKVGREMLTKLAIKQSR